MSGPEDLSVVVNPYDIRGLVPQQLDETRVSALAAGFADVVVIGDGGPREVVVGHDMRTTSPALERAVVAGLRRRGVGVVRIGLCSTDELYYASGHLALPGVMVTASHHPAGWNGLKLCRAGAAPVSQDSGLVEVAARAARLLAHDETSVEPLGALREVDVHAGYAALLRSLVDLSGLRPLTVVVDAGNGMAGLTVPAVLGEAAGLPALPVELVGVHLRLDGSLPHRSGGPIEAESVAELQAAVLKQHADLGLAFDADADRCLVVDEHGDVVSPSAITALIGLREVEREQRAGRTPTVIHNCITSHVVPDLMAAAGARTVRTRVGHSFVKAEMAAHDAVFGGEHSGHYYFRDFWFADDGLLAAMHVLAALGEQSHPMSALALQYQPYAASAEINVTVASPEAARERVVQAYVTRAGAGPVEVDELDGLTVSHWTHPPQWWFNLRASQTEAVLRINVEAADEDIMIKVRDDVLALVLAQED